MGISLVWVTGPEQGKKLKTYIQTGRKIQGRSLKRLLDV
jgi:hypothetical protein